MQATIQLDDRLFQDAARYAGVRSPDEVITQALRLFVRQHQKHDLRELRGKVKLAPDYDYKALRNAALSIV